MLTGRRRERDKDLERKELNWEEETHGNFKILENIVCKASDVLLSAPPVEQLLVIRHH